MSDAPPAKRRKVEREESGETVTNVSPILSLSDDILLLIFARLPSSCLWTIGETCQLFQRISVDKTLWKDVDLRDSPRDLKTCKAILKRLHDSTNSFAITGLLKSKGRVENLSQVFMSDLSCKCSKLKELVLENCYINGETIGFNDFPPSIEKLSLEGSEIFNLPTSRSYFKDISRHLPALHSLNLLKCGWVKNHCLMAICKLENLQYLNLRHCFKIGECFAYTALATRFGFGNLEFLDLRDTEIGDSELSCFGSKENIKELLVGGEYGEKLTDRGFESLWNKNIEKLTLTNTSLSEEGLLGLHSTLRKLRYLDVKENKQISKECIDALRNCSTVNANHKSLESIVILSDY